ncbi:MAG: FecR domain-containing protein [Myxococcales bacterium]|nr:FecR domain-containing protein [Myxococcales bacterium]
MRHLSGIVVVLLALGTAACEKKSEGGAEPAAGSGSGANPFAKGEPSTAPAAEPAGGGTESAASGGAAEPVAAGTGQPPGDQAGDQAAAAPDEPTEIQPPRLGYVKGTVQAIDGDGTHPVAEGATVLPGTVLVVEPEAQAELDLPDGSAVDLGEMTELLIRTASFDGEKREIDLAVLDGTVRIHAAPNTAEGSSFRVSTPSGTTEVQGTVYAVEVGGGLDGSQVAVFDGRVQVRAGDAVQVVAPPEPGVPAAVRIVPAAGIQTVQVEPVLVDRWADWTDRQADDLIERYEIDIQAPERIEAPVLLVEAQPYWAPQIQLRRARIATRAQVLVAAVGPERLVVLDTPRARFLLARQAWVPAVYVPRQARLEPARRVRLRTWEQAVQARVAMRAELAPTLVELRGAWVDRKGRVRYHGRGRGHGVVVVTPPEPTIVVGLPTVAVGGGAVVGGGVVVGGGAAVVVKPPAVTVGLPGVHVGGAVVVGGGAPAPVVVGGGGRGHGRDRDRPGAVVVQPAGPPGPTVITTPAGGGNRGRSRGRGR